MRIFDDGYGIMGVYMDPSKNNPFASFGMNGATPVGGVKPTGTVVPGASTTSASPATSAGGFGTAGQAPGVPRPAMPMQSTVSPLASAQSGGAQTSAQQGMVSGGARQSLASVQPSVAASAVAQSSMGQPGLQATAQPVSQPAARPIISSARSTARVRFNSGNNAPSGASARPVMSIPVQQSAITLNTDKAERSGARRWIIAVVAVLVLVAVGTGVVALLTSQQGGASAALSKFNTLAAYLESGAGYELANTGDDNEGEASVAYAVEVLGLAGEAVAKYYSGLDTRLGGFLTSAQGVVNAERTNEYQDDLKILQNAINYQAVGEAIINAYKTGGREGAKTYYESNIECNGSGELAAICEAEMGYYDALAYNYMVYSEAGCYKDGAYDTGCAISYYGQEQFLDKIGQMELPGTYLNGMIDDTARADLSEMVFTENATMREVLGNA